MLRPRHVISLQTDVWKGVLFALLLLEGTVMHNVTEKISARAQSRCHIVQFLTLAIQGMQETLRLFIGSLFAGR